MLPQEQAVDAARRELVAFAKTEPPAMRLGGGGAMYTWWPDLVISPLRPLVLCIPCVGTPFQRAIVKAGGTDRLALLLALASLDTDPSPAERQLSDAVGTLTSLPIVGALFFGATV